MSFPDIRLWSLLSLALSFGIWSCDATDHSGDPGLITIKVDSSASRFSRLTVTLQDSTGAQDTLFNDSLKNPAQLSRIATENYRGERTTVVITGYKGGVQVYQEKRVFTAAEPAVAKRDTVQDLTAPLTSLAWSSHETFLSIGDSSRMLTLSVLPAKSDGRAIYSLSDSSVITLRAMGKDAQGEKFRIVPRKSGQTWIKAVSSAHPEFMDSTSVQITAVVVVISKPVNRTPVWSTSSKPTWYWSSGGVRGNGFFRVRIDDDSMDGGVIKGDTAYTSPITLEDGPHILYVQEQDSLRNYSAVEPLPLRVDTDPPLAPVAENAGLPLTDNPRPAWTWTPQGKGIGKFRVKVDDGDLDAGAKLVDTLKYTSVDSLGIGTHTFRVQERDSAGNWSLSGSADIKVVEVDTTPPKAPLYKPNTGGEGDLYETVHWGSGGPDGTGVFRYLLDKTDFTKDHPIETRDSSFTPDPAMDTAIVRHNFLVQERDEIGNWSAATKFVFNTGRFSFIRLSSGATDYVLTLDPDSNGVGIAHKILAPADDSERAVQRRQLWQIGQNQSALGGSFIMNQFKRKIIRFDSAGNHPGVTADVGAFTLDSALVWDIHPAPFLGGTPPEPYQNIEPLLSRDQFLQLIVTGFPVSDSSSLITAPEHTPTAQRIWVFDRYKVWFLQ